MVGQQLSRFRTGCGACSEFTHAALVIGYGITNKGEKYWELMNSYSDDWGEKGNIS